ncbi:bacteriohemerythrin [Paraburkholderia caledonica]|uniref:Hemerythrin n=1 Tax=Paraburkholderia caledonica TaxID=134536 RepID=A0AB73IKZ6_9BURK|nr:hemerythrin [Paraburkholderia caledonica]
MDAVTRLEWGDCSSVGHASIDETHEEFATLVNAMLDADRARIPSLMEDLHRHIEEHFGLEHQLMERFDFPARECHVEEHDKVLASVREVRTLVATGNTEIAVELAVALANWFPGHSDYMDSALAAWVVKKTKGGAPLVLRRMKPQAAHAPF